MDAHAGRPGAEAAARGHLGRTGPPLEVGGGDGADDAGTQAGRGLQVLEDLWPCVAADPETATLLPSADTEDTAAGRKSVAQQSDPRPHHCRYLPLDPVQLVNVGIYFFLFVGKDKTHSAQSDHCGAIG